MSQTDTFTMKGVGLQAYRKFKGVTLQELSTALGVTIGTVKRFEIEPKKIRLDLFFAMAKFFNVSNDEMFYILFNENK